jgi:hypothetical protein
MVAKSFKSRKNTMRKRRYSRTRKGGAPNMAPNRAPIKLPAEFHSCIFAQEGKRFLVVSTNPALLPRTIPVCTPQTKAMDLFHWIYEKFEYILDLCSGRVSSNSAHKRFSNFNGNLYRRLEANRQKKFKNVSAKLNSFYNANNANNRENEYWELVQSRNNLEFETNDANAVVFNKLFVVFLVDDANSIDGFAFVDSHRNGLDVDILCTATKGQGSGTVLLNFLKKTVRDIKKTELHLESLKTSKSFYEKHGFVSVNGGNSLDMVFRV